MQMKPLVDLHATQISLNDIGQTSFNGSHKTVLVLTNVGIVSYIQKLLAANGRGVISGFNCV